MHGDFSYYAGRIASRVVAAYVDKQRRLAHNLPASSPSANAPVDVGAVWSIPNPTGLHPAGSGAKPQVARLHAGHFFVYPHPDSGPPVSGPQMASFKNSLVPAPPAGIARPSPLSPAHPIPAAAQLAAAIPEIPWKRQ
jgi:hypothetical protein